MGSGAPLLILHGGPGLDHSYFLPQFAELARDHKLIFIDQRANGRTEAPDSTKMNLSFLIEDIESGLKNSNDVGLVVVWETGERFKENYKITSYLDPDNLTLREYHGITHCITNINSGQKEMELIVLSELVDYLNVPSEAIEKQRKKYED